MICSRSPSWEGIPPGSNSHVLPSAARLSLSFSPRSCSSPSKQPPTGFLRKLQSWGTGWAPACLLRPVGPARGYELPEVPWDSWVFTQDGLRGQCDLTPDTHTQELGLCPFSTLPLGPDPFITALWQSTAPAPATPHGYRVLPPVF